MIKQARAESRVEQEDRMASQHERPTGGEGFQFETRLVGVILGFCQPRICSVTDLQNFHMEVPAPK